MVVTLEIDMFTPKFVATPAAETARVLRLLAERLDYLHQHCNGEIAPVRSVEMVDDNGSVMARFSVELPKFLGTVAALSPTYLT